MKRFNLEISALQHEDTRVVFLQSVSGLSGRAIAKRIGWSGDGSASFAWAVREYAWNEQAACEARRLNSDTAESTAAQYGLIAARIYEREIAPFGDLF